MAAPKQRVLILDFGSQYTQLIARRVRQARIYCEIHPPSWTAAQVEQYAPAAIILSGGPASVYDSKAPGIDPAILALDLPILGICYGLQLMAKTLGGRVEASNHREYGRAAVRTVAATGPGQAVFTSFAAEESFDVWMSHGDKVVELPPDFESLATTENTAFAAIGHRRRPLVGLQFHPEVAHTPRGTAILEAFLFDVARLSPSWTMGSFLEQQLEVVREQVGREGRVICALSGGVDSSVVAALLGRAIGPRVACIFVDNGLLRRGERDGVQELFGRALGLPLTVVDAREQFLTALHGVADPEQKRKIIGAEFIRVFEAQAEHHAAARFLAQGTLYPDVIESVSAKGGPSATIKSHHNVGGLPARMNLKLVEPLRELFKDEVRELGAELGLPHHLCMRQPFPGPGLAVRILGPVSAEALEIVRHADAVVEEEIVRASLYERCWQSFAVLLPVRSVGVMGDERTYEQTIALRCVDSVDGMTADWSRLPHEVLGTIANRVINEVRGVNRVVYDISSKPPATIEWE